MVGVAEDGLHSLHLGQLVNHYGAFVNLQGSTWHALQFHQHIAAELVLLVILCSISSVPLV